MYLPKKLKTFLLIPCFATCLLLIFCLCRPSVNIFTADAGYGSLQIKVVDGFSDQPLADAIVVIPETDMQYITDRSGNTPVISVPVKSNPHFEKLLAQPWGQVTVLVYKEGYLPYALFYTAIQKDQLRIGPTIYLFPEEGSDHEQPFIIIEGPDRQWAEALLEKYKP